MELNETLFERIRNTKMRMTQESSSLTVRIFSKLTRMRQIRNLALCLSNRSSCQFWHHNFSTMGICHLFYFIKVEV